VPRKKRMSGRTRSSTRKDAFFKVVNYLQDNNDEQITLQTLNNKMKAYLEGEDSLSSKYMKKRLQEYFGDEVVITTIQKKDNVGTFRGRHQIFYMTSTVYEQTKIQTERK